MGHDRLLVVEDDVDIANLLKTFFTTQGYEVEIANRGSEALEKTRRILPHLIILDIVLPDLDGFEVCRQLRTHARTGHIPVIFLTQKDERSDKLQGLELGADNYLTKPFDFEELKLYVQNAIARSERDSLTDPNSGLPSSRLIEQQLRKIIRQKEWALLDIRINHFEPFKEIYGFIAAGNVLRFTALVLSEALEEPRTQGNFIGHAGGDNFIIITSLAAASRLREMIKIRFADEVLAHYSFIDRQQGFVHAADASGHLLKYPLMKLSVGIVSPATHEFTDIREITELASEERRQDAGG